MFAEHEAPYRDMPNPFSYAVKKEIQFDAKVHPGLKVELNGVTGLEEWILTEEVAERCNGHLGAHLFRNGDKLERLGRKPNQNINVKIISQCDVEIECCQAVVQASSPADRSVVGPPQDWLQRKCPDLAEEKFADMRNRLGLQVLKYQSDASAPDVYKVGQEHMFEAGGIVSFRFCGLRYHQMCLVVSKEAAEAKDAAGARCLSCPFKIIVDETFVGSEQKLLIPVIKREDGERREKSLRVSSFMESLKATSGGLGKEDVTQAAEVSNFFFGELDFWNRSFDLSMCNLAFVRLEQDKLPPGPVVLGVEEQARQLCNEDIPQSPTDRHGRRAQPDVKYFSGLRSKLKGLSVWGVIHVDQDPCTLDLQELGREGRRPGEGWSNTHIECPPDPFTVLRGECWLLFPVTADLQEVVDEVFKSKWYDAVKEEEPQEEHVPSEGGEVPSAPPGLPRPDGRDGYDVSDPFCMTNSMYPRFVDGSMPYSFPDPTVIPVDVPSMPPPSLFNPHADSFIPYAAHMWATPTPYDPFGAHYQSPWSNDWSAPAYSNPLPYSHPPPLQSLSCSYDSWLDRLAKSHLERIPDSRPGRQTKPLKLWRTKRNSKVPTIPSDMFSDIVQNACDLATEPRADEDRQGPTKERNPSLGAEVMQKMMALGTPQQKCEIIDVLTSKAKILLHHDSGCFVVSQLLREGIDGEADVGLRALEFMAAAHEFDRQELYSRNLHASMTHTHANHSLKMWVQLLASLTSKRKSQAAAHLEAMLQVVELNAIDLVTDCQGVRTVNGLLEQFGNLDFAKVKPVLEKLVGNPEQLDDLIKHEFANFAINIAADFEPHRISRAVCTHFVEYALNNYGNYVLQKCVSSSACEQYLSEFSEAFRQNEETIMTQAKNGEAIKKGITRALRGRKSFEEITQIEKTSKPRQVARQ